MKKFINAQLQVVRVNNDIITMSVNTAVSVDQQYGADRFRDFEEY